MTSFFPALNCVTGKCERLIPPSLSNLNSYVIGGRSGMRLCLPLAVLMYVAFWGNHYQL